jgi:hypothetical protein
MPSNKVVRKTVTHTSCPLFFFLRAVFEKVTRRYGRAGQIRDDNMALESWDLLARSLTQKYSP